MNDLDAKIKSKFQLFTGVRPEEEDKKIYDKVYSLCLDEMITFIGENTDDAGREVFLNELENKNDVNDRIGLLLTSLTKIDNYSAKFNQRMDEYLDGIMQSSLAGLNN